MRKTRSYTAGDEIPIDQKNFLGLTVLLLLALNFTLSYLAYTYYHENLHNIDSPGFWISVVNYALLVGIVLLNKNILGWQWSDLGLAKPKTWWKPVVVSLMLIALLSLFVVFIQPHIYEAFGPQQNIAHLFALEGDLPRLIGSLIFAWITSAFLEELVFRAFLINTLDILLGSTFWSALAAVVISALIFGMSHSYQGVTGIMVTSSVGLIFGAAYLINGRRIWPLVFVHGLVHTFTMITFYNGAV